MKIALTGGHLTPALATMESLKKLRPDAEFVFFSRLHTREGDTAVSHEYTLLKEKGIPVYALTTGRLQRSFTRHTIPSLLKVPLGLYQSFVYLRESKPDIVVSFGGYLAVPVVIAAWILGIKVISHEQTLVPGLANQIISRFASTLALSFAETTRYYPHALTVVTGNPIRSTIFNPSHRFVLPAGLPVLYVTGGNQGSHVINETVFKVLPQLLEKMHVIHQTGNSSLYPDFNEGKRIQAELLGKTKGSYSVFEYIESDLIGDVLLLADVVVSRAGVNTLCELLALGKKAILIPIPKTSHDEQLKNARYWQSLGLGVMLEQAKLNSDSLVSAIDSVLSLKVSDELKQATQSKIKLDAADRLAELILSTL